MFRIRVDDRHRVPVCLLVLFKISQDLKIVWVRSTKPVEFLVKPEVRTTQLLLDVMKTLNLVASLMYSWIFFRGYATH
jgi:hypothetical protein